MPELSDLDRRLLNLIQQEFPLAPRPYAVLAERLGSDEASIIARIQHLRAERIIRQISAIFDTRALGYQSMLVAMQVPPERVDEAAAVINEHPGVSHNYKRDHRFNLWFTIGVPPTSDLEATVNRLHELAGAISTRMLPTLRLFKIGVKLDLTGESPLTADDVGYGYRDREYASQFRPTPRQIDYVRALQRDLQPEPEPYACYAAEIGASVEELLDGARDLLAKRLLRRMAAILYHRRAGFHANAMGVWAVPEERVQEVGDLFATFQPVSHCYQRPVYPDWPYNIFSMVHAHTRDECNAILAEMSKASGITEYVPIYSTKEYKKVRLLFYTDEYQRWEMKYLAATASR